jgi:hypothetical protein
MDQGCEVVHSVPAASNLAGPMAGAATPSSTPEMNIPLSVPTPNSNMTDIERAVRDVLARRNGRSAVGATGEASSSNRHSQSAPGATNPNTSAALSTSNRINSHCEDEEDGESQRFSDWVLHSNAGHTQTLRELEEGAEGEWAAQGEPTSSTGSRRMGGNDDAEGDCLDCVDRSSRRYFITLALITCVVLFFFAFVHGSTRGYRYGETPPPDLAPAPPTDNPAGVEDYW